MYRIIYPNNNSSINIIIPVDDQNLHHVTQLAYNQVPKDVVFKIITINDLPEDRIFRNAWTYDFTNYDGIGNGDDI